MVTTILFWTFLIIIAFATTAWILAPLFTKPCPKYRYGILTSVPVTAMITYIMLGNPMMTDQPLASRLAIDPENLPTNAIIVRLENQLNKRPNDATGWKLLARMRYRLGHYEKSADAWRRLISLNSENAEALAGLALALIKTDDGFISNEALALIDKAIAKDNNVKDSDNIPVLFWRGVAWQQQGNPSQAVNIWTKIRMNTTDNTPLATLLDHYIKAATSPSS